MANSTPGPWRVQEGSLTVYTTSDPEAGTGITNAIALPCMTHNSRGSDVGREEAKANAHLIAAAPALLDALEAVLPWVEANCDEDPEGCEDEKYLRVHLRAALAHARGEAKP